MGSLLLLDDLMTGRYQCLEKKKESKKEQDLLCEFIDERKIDT